MISRNIPLIDLHRHLDGNVRITTILDLANQFNIPLPANNIDDLIPHVQMGFDEPDFGACLRKLDTGVTVLANLDAVKRIAFENVEDLYLDNIDYAELRFSPHYMAMNHQLPIDAVIEATIDGVKSAKKQFKVDVNLIGIMSRTFGLPTCMTELDALLRFKQDLVAIDLAGNEIDFPPHLFTEHYKKVKAADLNVTVHAGEVVGAQSVWDAIRLLCATRIGHGVRSLEDPKLMDYLAANRIGVEMCLTSNVQTKTCASYETHPVKAFLQHGILTTLNSDDPAASGINLSYEYEVAAPKVGLTQADLVTLQSNSLDIAFLSESEKRDLKERVKARV